MKPAAGPALSARRPAVIALGGHAPSPPVYPRQPRDERVGEIGRLPVVAPLTLEAGPCRTRPTRSGYPLAPHPPFAHRRFLHCRAGLRSARAVAEMHCRRAIIGGDRPLIEAEGSAVRPRRRQGVAQYGRVDPGGRRSRFLPRLSSMRTKIKGFSGIAEIGSDLHGWLTSGKVRSYRIPLVCRCFVGAVYA